MAIFCTGIIIYKAFGNENLILIPSLLLPWSEVYMDQSMAVREC